MTESPEHDRTLGKNQSCFVISPIGDRLAESGSSARTNYEDNELIWEDVIEPACKVFGLSPVRSDKITEQGEVPEQIFRHLRDFDIVIADLSGGNPNVMYELGLRHTIPDKLTIQIGEKARLPFDVTVIRTMMFKRTDAGRIVLRNELIEALRTGIPGGFSAVSATRVWNERGGPPSDDPPPLPDDDDDDDDDGPDGTLEMLADGFDAIHRMHERLDVIAQVITETGKLATTATGEMEKSDARGGGLRGRLAITQRFAGRLTESATRLEDATADYTEDLSAMDRFNDWVLGRVESQLEDASVAAEYFTQILTLRAAAAQSNAGIAGLRDSVAGIAHLSKSLRNPTRKMTAALGRIIENNAVIDSWAARVEHINDANETN